LSELGNDFESSDDGAELSPVQLDSMLETPYPIQNSQAIGIARSLHDQSVGIAGMYLREAAFDLARRLLTRTIISNDRMIVRVETLLRAARRVGHPDSHLCGDPVPSIRRANGTIISLTARIVEMAGCDKLLLSEKMDDPRSRSKANLGIRSAREDVRRLAKETMLEGEIVA
jgi:hypothetical protein